MMIRHGFIQANGLNFHYGACGDPKAPLLLFLHGFPDFWEGWRAVMERLGDRFHCVAPDQRGYNLSSKPEGVEAYRTKQLVEDVRRIAWHLNGDKPFRLVGHDWGGAVAWALALKDPGRLHKLAIVNAVHPGIFQRELAQNPAQRAASTYIARHREPEAEMVITMSNYADLAANFEGVLDERQFAAYRAAWRKPGALTGMLNWYRAMRIEASDDSDVAGVMPYDAADLIVNVPTLVVWGMKDKALLPGCLDGLEAVVPRVQVVRVPEAGHFVTLQEPDLVAEAIGAFMAD